MTTKQKQTERVALAIKDWIMQQDLEPGDRLPGEAEIMETWEASKSTVREAMRILEAQGLIKTKSGPKGGTFVREVPESKVNVILSNYLFFKDVSIRDLYQLRIALEPQIAEDLAGKLSNQQLNELALQVDKYTQPPSDVLEERQHHIEALEFHRMLAEFSGNELLKMVVRFTAQMLSDLTVYRKLYEPRNYKLWRTGIESQMALIDALREGDGAKRARS